MTNLVSGIYPAGYFVRLIQHEVGLVDAVDGVLRANLNIELVSEEAERAFFDKLTHLLEVEAAEARGRFGVDDFGWRVVVYAHRREGTVIVAAEDPDGLRHSIAELEAEIARAACHVST